MLIIIVSDHSSTWLTPNSRSTWRFFCSITRDSLSHFDRSVSIRVPISSRVSYNECIHKKLTIGWIISIIWLFYGWVDYIFWNGLFGCKKVDGQLLFCRCICKVTILWPDQEKASRVAQTIPMIMIEWISLLLCTLYMCVYHELFKHINFNGVKITCKLRQSWQFLCANLRSHI